MSNTLNQLVCASSYGNSGATDCFLDMQKVEGFIIVPATWKKTPANFAAGIQTALQTDTYAVPATTRIFPVHTLVAMNDSSEDLIEETLGYGAKKAVREGYYDWKFEVGKGGLNLHTNLRKFNGRAVNVLFYDSNGTLWGADDGSGNMVGIPTLFMWTHPLKVNTGQNATKYVVQFVFHPKYLNDYFSYYPCEFDVTTVRGLLDVPVTMSNPSAPITNVVDVNVISKQGSQDLSALFGATLANATKWVVKRLDTGATMTITTVVANSGGGYKVTIDSTTFTALASGTKLSINLIDAASLNTAGVTGYEGVALIITKP